MSRRFAFTLAAVVFCGSAAVGQPSQLDEIAAQTRETKQAVDAIKAQSGGIKEWTPVIAAIIVAGVSALVTYFSLRANLGVTKELGQQNLTMSMMGLKEKAREEERKAIREKLDQFYGPMTQLRGVSTHLYKIFTDRLPKEVKDRYRDADGRFRTLMALTAGHKFEGVDEVVLKEIVRVGEESEKLIMDKVGLVDDKELQVMLWKAATHYRIIKLASDLKLVGGGSEFHEFTFPYDLDKCLASKMAALNGRLIELQTPA